MLLALALLIGTPGAGASSREQFDAGDFREAEAAAQLELAHDADRLDALLVLGQTQLILGRSADAVATLRRAAKAHPRSGEAFYRLGQALTLYVAESRSWRRLFMADDIGDAFEQAVELEPSNSEYRWALFEFCRHAPPVVGGGRKKAVAHARMLAKQDPGRGHRAQAALLRQDGNLKAAEQELRKAVEVEPGEPDHRYALGYFFQDQERWDDAFAEFERIARQFPQEAEAQFQVGKTAAMSGQRLDDGVRALQQYLRYKPKAGEAPHAWAHYRLGQVHERRKDAAAAKASYEAALKLDPKLADARAALAALNG